MLYEVLGIDLENEIVNTNNITETKPIKSKVYPTIESQINIYEESKSFH